MVWVTGVIGRGGDKGANIGVIDRPVRGVLLEQIEVAAVNIAAAVDIGGVYIERYVLSGEIAGEQNHVGIVYASVAVDVAQSDAADVGSPHGECCCRCQDDAKHGDKYGSSGSIYNITLLKIKSQ